MKPQNFILISLKIFVITLLIPNQFAIAGMDYVRDVRPILKKHCYSCHGNHLQKSGLRLDIKSEAFKGGELYDASIIKGSSTKSPLVQFVADKDADLQMPPEGNRLTKKEIEVLTNWVNEGANWPEGVDLAKLIDKRDHWSFKPVSTPKIPSPANPSWSRNDIDRFILARLEKEGLTPSKQADRTSWLRRVSFDLIGLPPTPKEVAAFIGDTKSDAYERVVERLLASPRYGERWAQHWLDVVRYADTHGFEVNTERPHAWPYRDYVIQAFNQDTPYDQFIKEQIVGDEMGKDPATGFLITASVLLPGQIGKDEPSKRLARQDSVDEIVVNIGQTFLGLSIGCARCHDHKFDPISQKEYYSMQAFVAGVEYGNRTLLTDEAKEKRSKIKQWKEQTKQIDLELAKFAPIARLKKVPRKFLRPGINPQLTVDRFVPVTTKKIRITIKNTNKLEPALDELEVFDISGTNVAAAIQNTKVRSSGNITVPNRHELKHINDGQYGNSRSWLSNQVGKGWIEFEFSEPQTIERVHWGRDRNGRYKDRLAINYQIEVMDDSGKWQLVANSKDRAKYNPSKQPAQLVLSAMNSKDQKIAKELLDSQKKLDSQVNQASKNMLVFAGKFRKPDEIHLLRRGDPEQPLEQVVPAVPSAIGSVKLTNKTDEQDRRKELANWIASPENRLTSRVMVNRIWLAHFGTGLVDTPNDFGRNGTKPSHPQLLDYLANEFVHSGWSIKHMHRLIVLSSTYRQSTSKNKSGTEKDANVRLLWRYPTRRMEGELIRDSILAINGNLNLKMHGPGYNLFNLRGGLVGYKPIETFPENGLRRMIYAHRVRRERDAVFGVFDCPDGGQSLPGRKNSTTPIQALNLFNSKFVIDQAKEFANRIEAEFDDVEHQIRRAYLLALNREPNQKEIEETKPVINKHGLLVLCRALYNSNEFLFIP